MKIATPKVATTVTAIVTALVGLLNLTTHEALAQQQKQAKAQTISIYDSAIELYDQGRYPEALALFDAALRQNPRNVYARNYIGKCKLAIRKGVSPKNTIREQLEKIVLPSIAFEDASIGDVLVYMTARAEELTGGKFTPSFVYKGTTEQRDNTLLTMSLRNVPMTEAIRYVGQLTKTKFTYEEHAIVADPNRFSISPAQAAAGEANKVDDGSFGPQKGADPFSR